MSINKILNSLDKSWERDDIILKIKNGLDTDKIVNEFLANNEIQIKELNTLLRPEDIDLLNQVEKLSTCESKLINKIKNLNYIENNENNHMMSKKKILPFKKDSIILHPLARGSELSTSLDQTSKNWYFAQSRGAVFVRMALLTCLMDRTTRVMDVV